MLPIGLHAWATSTHRGRLVMRVIEIFTMLVVLISSFFALNYCTTIFGQAGQDVADSGPLLLLAAGLGNIGTPLDLDGDGTTDGTAYDTNGDGVLDAIAWTLTPGTVSALLDTNNDGIFDAIDTNGDGTAEAHTCSNTGGLTTGENCTGSAVNIVAGGLDTDGDGAADISFQTDTSDSGSSGSGSGGGATPATPKFIFVTAATFGGILGGFTGADALCNADANKPNSSTYKAGLAGNSAFAANQEYTRPDSTTIGTTDGTGSLTTPLTSSIAASSPVEIWTGGDGTNCSSWTANSTCGIGLATSTTVTFWNNGNEFAPISTNNALYCVEQ